MVKQEGMQYSTLAETECSPEADDQCLAPHRTKAESLTTISSLRFISSTKTRDIDVKPSSSMNTEEIPPSSRFPTHASDPSAQILKSRTPTPLPTETSVPEDGFNSKSTTPPVATQGKTPRRAGSAPLQLIGDLPVAREEALASFSEIQVNNYQNKSLGRSRELLESMTCECTYEPGSSSIFLCPGCLVVSTVLFLIEPPHWRLENFSGDTSRSALRTSLRLRHR